MALPRIPAYPLPDATEVPHSPVSWRPEAARLALLVHDMQAYFCAAFGEGTSPLTPAVAHMAQLIQAARAAGVPVFYTAQKGGQFLPDRGLQADYWGPGMRSDPAHEAILPDLAPQGEDITLVKHRYSAFQRSNLETLMRARGRDQLAILGVYAHIGCLATAVEAFQRDIQPFAVADAQADFDRERHMKAMQWIAGCCGQVTTTAALLAALGSEKTGEA